jgi:hypothetical protein
MFISKPATWLALAAASTCGTAMAQGTAAATPPPYRSALEGYKPFADEKVAPWAQSNATVGRIGGWRAYAREASEGQSPAEPATQPPAQPAGNAVPAAGHKH